MLGFSPVLLQVFSTMLGFTLNMISCISFYNIFLCLFHMRSDLEHAAGMSCSQARGLDNKNYSTWLLWLACLCRLGGWMPQNYSMLTHVKTGGKKILHCVPRLLDPLFQILEFGFKARGLRDTCHRRLFFKFLEDKDQKIED